MIPEALQPNYLQMMHEERCERCLIVGRPRPREGRPWCVLGREFYCPDCALEVLTSEILSFFTRPGATLCCRWCRRFTAAEDATPWTARDVWREPLQVACSACMAAHREDWRLDHLGAEELRKEARGEQRRRELEAAERYKRIRFIAISVGAMAPIWATLLVKVRAGGHQSWALTAAYFAIVGTGFSAAYLVWRFVPAEPADAPSRVQHSAPAAGAASPSPIAAAPPRLPRAVDLWPASTTYFQGAHVAVDVEGIWASIRDRYASDPKSGLLELHQLCTAEYWRQKADHQSRQEAAGQAEREAIRRFDEFLDRTLPKPPAPRDR